MNLKGEKPSKNVIDLRNKRPRRLDDAANVGALSGLLRNTTQVPNRPKKGDKKAK